MRRETEAGGVASGDFEGTGGNIRGVDGCGWKFFCQGDGDAAGASADIDEGEIFASEAGVAAGADFANSKAVESDFDEVLGFGAGNENVGSDFEFETPKFLFACEMLRRLAIGAAADERRIIFSFVRRQEIFRMRIDPGAVATRGVEKQKLRRQREGGDVARSRRKLDAAFQQAANGLVGGRPGSSEQMFFLAATGFDGAVGNAISREGMTC